ncbi:MAG: hypothetical protein MUC97_03890 [Bernardetiaceae bacterium]|jgi:hypothetical protein|nr:hypothetical protein [Bernardetiaceae bacterium]
MKNTTLRFWAVALLGLAGLTACRQDEGPSTTDLLTQSPWITTSMTVDPVALVNGRVTSDVFRNLPPCDQDDLFELTAEGRYFFTEGPTRCQPQRPQVVEEGTWVMKDDKVFTLSVTSSTGFPVDWNIVEVTPERLQVVYAVPRGGIIYTYNRTFARAPGR